MFLLKYNIGEREAVAQNDRVRLHEVCSAYAKEVVLQGMFAKHFVFWAIYLTSHLHNCGAEPKGMT